MKFEVLFPCTIAVYSNKSENNILKASNRQALIKIKWYRNYIPNDPKNPMLDFSPCHEPHPYKKECSGKGVNVSGPRGPQIKIKINLIYPYNR
jgi:hypothetical protein